MPSESFVDQLGNLLNRYSKETVSNTPDFVLANYLNDCLDAFNKATNRRDIYSGHVPNVDVKTKIDGK